MEWQKSGTILTAAFAKEQNRQIFVAPNSIYSKESTGANKLIQDGANIYLNLSQLILEGARKPIVNIKREITATIDYSLTNIEKVILSRIKDNPMTLGELLIHLKEDKSDILESISIMELKGMIVMNEILQQILNELKELKDGQVRIEKKLDSVPFKEAYNMVIN